MNDPETEKRFAELQIIKVGGSPADMRKLIQDDTAALGRGDQAGRHQAE